MSEVGTIVRGHFSTWPEVPINKILGTSYIRRKFISFLVLVVEDTLLQELIYYLGTLSSTRYQVL